MKNFNIAGLCFLLFGLAGGVDVVAFETTSMPVTPAVALAPTVRSRSLPSLPPTALATRALAPFLALPLVVGQVSENALRVVIAPQGRRYVGAGDQVEVQGELREARELQILRAGRRLLDPRSQEYLGDEFQHIGTARWLASAGDRHRFLIVDARQEVAAGDVLSALPHAPQTNILPQPATLAGEALIVSVLDGAAYAAQYQIVAINKGARDQLREGAELRLYASPEPTRQVKQAAASSQFPEEERGRLLISRVFDRVSYGLITQAGEALQVGDKARAPRP